jgi:hypothetical protein
LKISWSKSNQNHDLSDTFSADGEITPEAWANSLIQFMTEPDTFEFISTLYGRMVAAEPKLKVTKGMLAKFVNEECDGFLESVKRNGQLLVRRRKS